MTFRSTIRTAASSLRTHAGVAVTYARGAVSVSIPLVIKFPSRKRAAFDQVAIDSTIQEWGIAIADLILSASVTAPARGDVITFVEDGVTSTYEVLPDEGDAVSHLVAGDSQHRIHTKRTGSGGSFL